MIFRSNRYKQLWAVDFEFIGLEGDRPDPVCLVARDLITGREIRLWRDQFSDKPPYDIGDDSLFIAYNVAAEIGCHLALGWKIPINIIDLYPEFRTLFNGLKPPHGWGLLSALSVHGLPHIDPLQKAIMRDLILSGEPWTDGEKEEILDYCHTDVVALENLSGAMFPKIDIPRALLRGQYMANVAVMEFNGVLLDGDYLERLKVKWETIKLTFLDQTASETGIYEGTTFKTRNFLAWTREHKIPWPLLPSGSPDLKDQTFKDMSIMFPEVAPIREARNMLSRLRLSKLAVGKDGRNRTGLFAFGTKTGRNAPSTTKSVFGPSVWIRHLIIPPKGCGIAYIDWSGQEFGIGAILSGDPRMLAAYESGDPYLNLGKQLKLIPPDGTKDTHPLQRDKCKSITLACNYGMGPHSLAALINQPPIVARKLLEKHKQIFRKFWEWSDAAVDHAILLGHLTSTFGWTIRLPFTEYNPRSLRNFLLQSNGAEMMRLAVCFTIQRGVKLCLPVHDALLIESTLDSIKEHIALTREAMDEASRLVLDGFTLRTDVQEVQYPDRYSDKRGISTWETIKAILMKVELE